MTAPLACWRCRQYGHAAAECQPAPAETRQQLDQRIAELVERWQEFEITLDQKRAWIADEMRIYEKARKA